MLVARALRVDHGSRAVLSVDRLELCRGRFGVVLGPNGAGKTTLLRALAGLAAGGRGEVTWMEGDHPIPLRTAEVAYAF